MSYFKDLNQDGEIVVGEPTTTAPETNIEETVVPEEVAAEQLPEEVTTEPTPVVEEVTTPPITPEQESSLTPESQETPVQEPVTEPTLELNDDIVAKYLSEKLGKEVNDLSELAKEPEPVATQEEDPYIKELSEWRKRTNRPVSDWIKFQKDYDGMANIDVVRESLQLQYPDLTPEEIKLELSNYAISEDDLEEDKIRKQLNLKKAATEGRRQLNELKSEFDTPIEAPASLSPVEKQKIEYYDQMQAQLDQQKKVQEDYNRGISSTIQSLEAVPIELSEGLSIDFKVPQENKSTLQEYMQMKHWFNEDGTYNHRAVVEDSIFVQNKDQILKLAFEQGVAKGKEDSYKEERNITLDGSRPTMENSTSGNNGIVVEGDENFRSDRGMKIQIGRK